MTSLLLLSGGIDSISIANWIRPEFALTVDYGQRAAEAEWKVSAHICSELNIKHEKLTIDCSNLGFGLMSKQHINVELRNFNVGSEWWPFRNQLIITIAASRALYLGANKLVIGTVSSDKKHLDGTQGFLKRMKKLLSYQEGNLKLIAPAIKLSSFQLVQRSGISAEYLSWAYSCHTGNIACGICPGCQKNIQVLEKLIPATF